jgi:hypothetical protein
MQHCAKVPAIDLKSPANFVLIPLFKKDLFQQPPIFGGQPIKDLRIAGAP